MTGILDIKNFIYLYFSFFLFQNCAPFEPLIDSTMYPYSTQPAFFWDFKLVKTEVDTSDRELFVFDLALSYASNPQENVGYRIDFSTISQTGICSFVDGTVNNQNNHIQAQCKLPVDDDLFVRLIFVGVNDEEQTQEFRY